MRTRVKIVWAAAVAVLLFGVIGAGAATGTATRQPLRATDTAASVQTRALAPVAPASGSSRSPVTARSTGSRATPAPPLPGVSAVLYD